MFRMLAIAARALAPRRATLITGFIFSVLSAMFVAAPIGALYWFLTHRDNIGLQMTTIVTLVVVGIIGELVSQAVTQAMLSPLGFIIFSDERVKFGDRLKNAPMGFFHRHRLGDITSAVTTTMNDAEMFLAYAFQKILNTLVSFIMVTLFLLWIDWRIGLVAFAVFAIAVGCVEWMNRATKRVIPQRQEIQKNMVGQVMDFLGGASLLRSFHCETVVAHKLYRAFRDSSRFGFKSEMDVVPPTVSYLLTLKLGTLVIAGFGIGLHLFGLVSLEIALLMAVAAFVLTVPLEGLTAEVAMLRISTVSLEMIEPVLQAPQQEVITGRSEDGSSRCAIEFDGVTFAYEARDVLRDVSVDVPQGSTVALIGPSGSGKTTFCHVMMRFWDVHSGTVRVQGRDVKAWEPDELLSQFAVVFQNVYLFSDTIANNIRFGNLHASDEELRDAARRARCLEFIESLPDGFDTVLAEGGSSLSGGERQRISIARAMMKDAPIVILDEATSSVDPENERDLQLAIDELCAGKTRIVIAHNMATVRDADQILVFDEGAIVQRGTHDELAGESGIYRDFLDIRAAAAGWHIKN
ncbi:MAG: ABC transporter ATP-binding protein [Actinomycetaceae bacterium]|nr:ABC transporter ATP-binding protein [Actinomycetaceae bacterium]